MVERQARDLKVRGTNPGPGSNFSLEFKFKLSQLRVIISLNDIISQEIFTYNYTKKDLSPVNILKAFLSSSILATVFVNRLILGESSFFYL